MSLNLRYPNITGASEREQIAQIRSYLHQLVEQLNYALPAMGTEGGSAQIETSQTYDVQGVQMSYFELRSLILQEIKDIDSEFEKLAIEFEKQYIKNTEEERNKLAVQIAQEISFSLDEDGNLYYEVEEINNGENESTATA